MGNSMFYKASNFNQCLSTWADKTPPDVNVVNLFVGSGCPDKNPVGNIAPWCQGDNEQCFAPSEDCNDCDSRPKIEVSGTAFKRLVSSCDADSSTCPYTLPFGCWDTSEVTDMSYAFASIASKTSFDDSINCWNTARVTTMNNMFDLISNFNQPLNDWNVSSVNNMIGMFGFTTNFNQPLDDWNVASVTSMKEMFERAPNFNQPLDDWDVASVTLMNKMFAGDFNQCLSTWADKTP